MSDDAEHPPSNEITALLPQFDSQPARSPRKPPSYSAVPHSANSPSSPIPSSHRSIQNLPPPRPIPLRKSPYSSWPIRLTFMSLVFLAFISTTFFVVLALNVWFPRLLAPYLPMHRSSRVLPAWYAAVAMWLSLSTISLFWTPSMATRVSLVITGALAILDLILLVLVPEFLHRESNLTVLACFMALLVTGICFLSNRLIQHAKEEEGKIIENRATNLREAERRAEMLFVAEERIYWSRHLWRGFKLTISFLIVFCTSIILGLITIDLLIRAYDSTYPLPFKNSRLYSVRPSGSSSSFQVHLMCAGPTALRPPTNVTSLFMQNHLDRRAGSERGRTQKVPTVLYEAPSPLSGTEGAEWLLQMRERGKIGRVCLWDRPGYGFSDASSNAEIGHVEDALWDALQKNSEKGPFLIVGEGYGGLLTRIFSARHPDLIAGHVYIDAETSHTYFLSPHRQSPFLHSQLPSILAPLSLRRILTLSRSYNPSPNRSLRLTRILSPTLNPLALATRFQEHSLSHTPYSPSFTTLLASLKDYPSDAATIVVSSGRKMDKDKRWATGQKSLWEEVTDERGRVRWTTVDVEEEGRICKVEDDVCEDAVMELAWS